MAKATPEVPTPGFDLNKIFRGSQQYVLVPGADAYTKLRPGPADLVNGDTTLRVEVKAKFIGSLFNLVRDYGRETIYAAGQTFDATMIFDHLDDNGMPTDPREVYTAVSIIVPNA